MILHHHRVELVQRRKSWTSNGVLRRTGLSLAHLRVEKADVLHVRVDNFGLVVVRRLRHLVESVGERGSRVGLDFVFVLRVGGQLRNIGGT